MFIEPRVTRRRTPAECNVPTFKTISPLRREQPPSPPYYKHSTPSGVAQRENLACARFSNSIGSGLDSELSLLQASVLSSTTDETPQTQPAHLARDCTCVRGFEFSLAGRRRAPGLLAHYHRRSAFEPKSSIGQRNTARCDRRAQPKFFSGVVQEPAYSTRSDGSRQLA